MVWSVLSDAFGTLKVFVTRWHVVVLAMSLAFQASAVAGQGKVLAGERRPSQMRLPRKVSDRYVGDVVDDKLSRILKIALIGARLALVDVVGETA